MPLSHLHAGAVRRTWWAMPLDPAPLVSRVPMVPVLTIERADQAVPLARALTPGGLSLLEGALRTPASADAPRAIIREASDAVVGLGTVTRLSDIDLARDIGAKFLVTPGT